jgi:hypothetical protein
VRHVLAPASRGLSDAEVWPGTPVPPPPRGFTEDVTGAKPRIDPSAMSDDELRAAYAREQGANSSPTCEEALIAAYQAGRAARTGNVFYRLDPVPHAARPCIVTDPKLLSQYNGGDAAPVTHGFRAFRFEGWEMRAPAGTTDEAIVRVLDALSTPVTALAPPKSP